MLRLSAISAAEVCCWPAAMLHIEMLVSTQLR
jgi:hypothetical protein